MRVETDGMIHGTDYVPATAPLFAVYSFFLDPSGCLAWNMQKYLLCPLSDSTVPMQFFGLMLISRGSGNVKFRIFLNQGSPADQVNVERSQFCLKKK